MSKKLIRVTQLESFRKYLNGDEDRDRFVLAEQDVIDSITGVFTGNNKTRIGTAFHRIVEGDTADARKAEAGERTFLYYGKEKKEPVPIGRTFNVDGYDVTLDIAQCKVALAYKDQYPDAFHEIREYMDFGDVVVTGCADMIDGFEIRDIKTKYSEPYDTEYIESAQWRYYMEMFGADAFHFDLFHFHDYNDDKHGTDVRGLLLTRHEPAITCHYYNQLETDNRRLLEEFVKWAKVRNVYDLIPDYNQESINNLR